MRRQLIADKAGVLDFYPPESRRTDSTATLSTYIEGSSTWVAAKTLTQEATSLTLGTAAKGAKEVSSSSTTAAIIGRRYLITTTREETWEGTLVGKTAALLIFSEPFPFAIPTTSTCKGLLFRATFDTTDTATRYRRLRAVIDYAIDAEPIRHVFFFDVVLQRYGFDISLSELEQAWSSVRQHLGDINDWQQVTRRIIEDVVFPSLEADGFYPDLIREQEALKPWAVMLTIEQIIVGLIATSAVPEKLLEYYTAQAGLAHERLISNKHRWYDSGDMLTGAGAFGAQFVDSSGTWVRTDGGDSDGWTDGGMRPDADPVL